MANALPKLRVFDYIAVLDAFDVTEQYREISNTLGIAEWNPVVWIGRLFTMDNDVGEHWFDNWDLREDIRLEAEKLGRDADELLIIDPERFQDGRDGPCNTPEFRKRFWTDVLISLELDPQLIFDKARAFNRKTSELLEEYPDDPDYRDDFIPDLEDRIAKITQNLTRENKRMESNG